MQKNNNQQFYEDWYDRISDSPTKSGNAKWEYYLLRCILKYINKNNVKSLLDVGCGQGNKTAYISEYLGFIQSVGLDASKSGIALADKLYSNCKNLKFINSDLNEFSSENEDKYDIVSALEVLEHIEDWQTLLNNMINVSNRYILLTFPTGRMRDYERKIGHLRNFKRGEVENFLDLRGFKIVKTFYSGFPLYTPLARDYINKHYDSFMQSIDTKFTKSQELFHNFVYLSFKYFCFKNIGDKFTGLFIKDNITTNSNGGGYYRPNNNLNEYLIIIISVRMPRCIRTLFYFKNLLGEIDG